MSARRGSGSSPGRGLPIEWASALAALPDPLFVMEAVRAPDGTVVEFVYAFLNEAAARLYGKSVDDEVLGHGQFELFPSVKELGIWDTYLGVIESGSATSVDVPWFQENGVEGSFRLTAAKFGDGILISATDTTAQVKAGEALETDRAALRATLDSLMDPQALCEAVRDETGRVVDLVYLYANPATYAYFGMNSPELIGRRLLDIFPGALEAGLMERYAQVIETGKPLILDDFHYEIETMHAERRYDIRAARVGDGASISWRDVTERNAQAEQDRRTAAIVEQSKDAIIGTALPHFNIVSWNSAAERMYGYTAAEVIGRPADFLLPEDQRAQAQAFADTLAAGQSIPDFEAIRLRKNGTPVPVAISVSTTSDEHGKITGIVTFHRDITAQIEARSAIEEQAANERQRLAELEHFQRLVVGRELKMIELKKEIEHLKKYGPAGSSDLGDQFET